MRPRASSRLLVAFSLLGGSVILAVVAFVLLGGSVILVNDTPSGPQEWGSVRGRVVWTGETIPENPPIPDDPFRPCLANGPILQNELVVNAKNRGVRSVLVWLADPKDASNVKFAPPIHPSLANPPDVRIDTPCCEYEPRVVGLWGTQKLEVKNSGPNVHNFTISSIGKGTMGSSPVLPERERTIEGFVPSPYPLDFKCGVHYWMRGYVGSFAHPYFAVTDADGNFEIAKAPAGKFQLILWHEGVGFLTKSSRKLRGKVIEIEGQGVTDVGKVGMKAVDD